jgi:hypothetical protein
MVVTSAFLPPLLFLVGYTIAQERVIAFSFLAGVTGLLAIVCWKVKKTDTAIAVWFMASVVLGFAGQRLPSAEDGASSLARGVPLESTAMIDFVTPIGNALLFFVAGVLLIGVVGIVRRATGHTDLDEQK